MTESAMQPEAFPKDFCMFDTIVVQIDLNRSLMTLSLIIVSAFGYE